MLCFPVGMIVRGEQLGDLPMKVMQFIIATVFVAGLVIASISQRASANPSGGSVAAHGATSVSAHSTHQSTARSQRRHRGRNTGAFWPTAGGFYYGPANGKPEGDVTEPISGDGYFTCTYNIPWDWAHRCPPFVSGSERVVTPPVFIPHEPGCPGQTVTVPRGDGKTQTVTIVRC